MKQAPWIAELLAQARARVEAVRAECSEIEQPLRLVAPDVALIAALLLILEATEGQP